MRLMVVNGIEADGVARAVDARTYARGLLFAQRRAVRATEWDDEVHRAVCRRRRRRRGVRGSRVLPAPQGAAGVHVRRVHVPGRDELCTRRRLRADSGRLLRRRCRHGGAPALGTHAPHAVRPGPTVARRPARAGAARPRALPVLRSHGAGVALGPDRAARAHRLGRRRPDLAQRELALLTGQLRAGTRAGPGRAVCAPQRRRQARRLPLRRVRPDDRPHRGRTWSLVRPGRGGRGRAAARPRAQAVRRDRPL